MSVHSVSRGAGLLLFALSSSTGCGDKAESDPADSGAGESGGTLEASSLEVSPDPLDFGEVGVSCSASEGLTLTNLSDGELEVREILLGGDFDLVTEQTLPFALGPSESSSLEVGLSPGSEGAQSGEVEVVFGAKEAAFSAIADLTGAGVHGPEVTDSFVVGAMGPVDLLLVVDTSASMQGEIEQLVDAYSHLESQLDEHSPDWQLAVITEDNACTTSGVLSPVSSGRAEAFEAALSLGGDTYPEALLALARMAVEQTGEGGCNEGLLREGATLHVVAISDAADASQDLGEGNFKDNLEAMQEAKGDEGLVVFSAIVGDYPGGCSSADPGQGYYEAAVSTGGAFLSICQDLASDALFDPLAAAPLDNDRFELSAEPVESTLWVTVNGEVPEDGWTIDDGVVELRSAVPGEGSEVVIHYSTPATCE